MRYQCGILSIKHSFGCGSQRRTPGLYSSYKLKHDPTPVSQRTERKRPLSHCYKVAQVGFIDSKVGPPSPLSLICALACFLTVGNLRKIFRILDRLIVLFASFVIGYSDPWTSIFHGSSRPQLKKVVCYTEKQVLLEIHNSRQQ